MLEIGKQVIHISGLSIITSNDVAHNDIGKLWGSFLANPIKEKLGDLISQDIFSVYSDYENGFKGKYRTTIGYAVTDPAKIPTGLTLVTLPAGNYKTYKPKSAAPADVVATWQDIWASDPNVLRRNFIADFEVYNGEGVNIYVGHL